jgi:hypothetical protein
VSLIWNCQERAAAPRNFDLAPGLGELPTKQATPQ